MGAHKWVELGDEPLVLPEDEPAVDPLGECDEPELLEALNVPGGRRLQRDVGEDRAAPECER
jgi:hypothetical protein